jgi:CHAT domain-containing protein
MGVAPVHYGYVRLPELHESDQSLNALTGYFDGATNFIGERASRKNFLRQFGDYRIIQLYTHAADNKEKGEPVIWFADSLLYLSDLISDKKPATRLVVLSACETGTGKFYQGEGVFSFNRGFAALGIPAAITSLWSADNKKTYELTRLFYKYLSIGDPADVALQHAKLEFIRNGPRQNTMPWAWAVPVLTGKVTPMVQLPPARSLWFTTKGGAMAATGLVVVFVVWSLYRRFRAGKQGGVERAGANGR